MCSEQKPIADLSIPAPDYKAMFDTITDEQIALLYGVDVLTVRKWARKASAR